MEGSEERGDILEAAALKDPMHLAIRSVAIAPLENDQSSHDKSCPRHFHDLFERALIRLYSEALFADDLLTDLHSLKGPTQDPFSARDTSAADEPFSPL